MQLGTFSHIIPIPKLMNSSEGGALRVALLALGHTLADSQRPSHSPQHDTTECEGRASLANHHICPPKPLQDFLHVHKTKMPKPAASPALSATLFYAQLEVAA